MRTRFAPSNPSIPLTLDEAATALGVEKREVKAMIRDGVLPIFRHGRVFLVMSYDVERLLRVGGVRVRKIGNLELEA